jgi:hypothetical protein
VVETPSAMPYPRGHRLRPNSPAQKAHECEDRQPGHPALPSHSHASAASAPRGALLYPRLSREELEGRFLGLMADLDGKPEGDNSMPGK